MTSRNCVRNLLVAIAFVVILPCAVLAGLVVGLVESAFSCSGR